MKLTTSFCAFNFPKQIWYLVCRCFRIFSHKLFKTMFYYSIHWPWFEVKENRHSVDCTCILTWISMGIFIIRWINVYFCEHMLDSCWIHVGFGDYFDWRSGINTFETCLKLINLARILTNDQHRFQSTMSFDNIISIYCTLYGMIAVCFVGKHFSTDNFNYNVCLVHVLRRSCAAIRSMQN